ncbi:MAG: ATP-dependent Clp protease ATP-binding subunit [Lachnospiraceae bacterium]|jgi:ATP-dependent Clp protease ATP-binding subunit ClpC|nr:ATP-dependent Clp protease ATP-binding subunit [Lachnospiraceae bacterium]MED9806137.1 ATP-dependent Clp protease ATP-binding subunit [Lachnospiraceae bacterium]MEE0397565.1 ATP-dependent Clp protease ATP-binding subunit [Lachnospiraceae bacterium]
MQLQFTDSAKAALSHAEKTARKLQQGYVGTEHILIGLLKEGNGVAAKVLFQNGVDEKQVMDIVKDLITFDGAVALKDKENYSPRAQKVLAEAHRLAERFHEKLIGTEHILMALIKEGENVAVRLLNTLGVSTQKVYIDVLISIGEDSSLYKEDLAKNRPGNKGGSMLSQFSRDLTAMAEEGSLDPVIGREDEIQRVIQILSRRTKNNPCLIGEPGVGKTAIVEGLALRIVSGDVPFTVKDKRVLTLDLSAMVAGSKYRGEFEERIKKVVKEVIDAGNIILFLDELHTIIGAGGAEGAIDASNILKPSLARGEIQLIGATTINEYRKYVEKDAALERRFQPVNVEEPDVEASIRILNGIRSKYEEHHHVEILPEAVEAAVKLSDRYINDRNLPDKAIDLIDEAAAAVRLSSVQTPARQQEMLAEIAEMDKEIENYVKADDYERVSELKRVQDALIKKYERLRKNNEQAEAKRRYVVDEEDIARVVSVWTKVPLEKIAEKESERLLKLEDELHKRVIGQEEAVTAVAKAMRRGRTGLKDPNRPIGSFLFLGPTGVGKTELCKALAEAMFGSENALIRVDMSEYMEGHSVSKMIGSPPGYVGFEEGGQLSEKVRRNPYSVVLFDEIEKAHPDVFNILLQVLDDGHITDSKGRKVSFKNTVLIMTSNAGAQRIVDPKNLGFTVDKSEKKDYDKMKSGVMEEVKKIFKPEFINRIDEIIVFHQLSKDNMKSIVSLLASNLSKRCEEQLQIKLKFSPALKEYLVEKHSDKKMGARPLKRAIQSLVEDALAEEILRGNVKPGDMVTAGIKDEKVTFHVKNQ